MEVMVHPHVAQTLTTERIRGWQERAAQARLAKEARAARRAQGGRRGWDIRRIRVPAITGLASPSSGPTSPVPPVTAQRGAVAGRPAGADGRQPATADGRQPATADELGLATADEHQPMTAGVGQPGADGRQPAGPRAA
jgi:hypothetical protein